LEVAPSEFHGVGLVILGEGKAGSEVLLHDGVLVVLDILDESGVDDLLEGGTFGVNQLLLHAFGEESFGISLLGLVVTDEHLIIDLGHINASNVNLGAGGEGVDLVDALKGHTVDLVGSGNKEQAGTELLEADDSLATEATGEEDENATRFDSLTELGGSCLLGSELSLDILGRVPLELFDH